MKQFFAKDIIFYSLFVVLAFLPEVYSIIPSVSIILLIVLSCVSIKDFFLAKITKVTLCWLFYIFVTSIGCIYSAEFSYAVGHVVKITLLTFTLSFKPEEKHIKPLFFFIQIIVLFSILSIILEIPFGETIRTIRDTIIVDKSGIDRIERISLQYSSMYGIFADTAVAAFFCACGVALFWYLYVQGSTKYAILWIVLSSFALYLTNKRGPLLSILISFMIVLFLYMRLRRRNNLLSYALLFIIFSTAIYVLQSEQFSQYFDRINSNTYSIQTRNYLYKELWNRFKSRPLLGYGTKSSRYFFDGLDAHNIFLGILFENGILGLVSILLVFYSSLKSLLSSLSKAIELNDKQIMSVCYFCLLCVFYFICYGMTGNPMTTIHSLALFFFCVSLPNHLLYIDDNKTQTLPVVSPQLPVISQS